MTFTVTSIQIWTIVILIRNDASTLLSWIPVGLSTFVHLSVCRSVELVKLFSGRLLNGASCSSIAIFYVHLHEFYRVFLILTVFEFHMVPVHSRGSPSLCNNRGWIFCSHFVRFAEVFWHRISCILPQTRPQPLCPKLVVVWFPSFGWLLLQFSLSRFLMILGLFC